MRVVRILLLLFCAVRLSAQTATQPNVVLIITDDMGWADIGPYGSKDIRTPNIDRLAKSGVRFTDFYANGVLCSPTRAGLITGRYQQRYGVEVALPSPGPAGDLGLRANGRTFPQLMKSAVLPSSDDRRSMSSPAACAIASIWSTPGITGFPG